MTCTIIPPYMLEQAAAKGDAHLQRIAERTLATDERRRAERSRGLRESPAPSRRAKSDVEADALQRAVHDAKNTEDLPGELVRGEGDPSNGDVAVDEAYDGLGATWALFNDAFGRRSLDDRGMPLLATVHFSKDYDNAFWDGRQMVFGDGDGRLFNRFTASIDVIGHELAHGVTEHTAGLIYRDQSGALNESVSDVFGVMVRQLVRRETAAQSDWLIGAELLASGIKGVALRSIKEPGTAYDDEVLGKDPQPGHMDQFVETTQDNGGVHINSGIPNRAFYLASTAIGGYAWEGSGLIWYDVLVGDGIKADCDFATFAHLCVKAARSRFGAKSSQATVVGEAWEQVGVTPKARRTRKAAPRKPIADEAAPTTESTGTEPEVRTPAQRDGTTPRPAQGVPAEVVVRRTGGVAGVPRVSRIDLDAVPAAEADEWKQLLASATGDDAQALADTSRPGRPDAFNYEVQVEGSDINLTIPESALPGSLRDSVHKRMR